MNAFNRFYHNIDPSLLADFKSFISSSTELVIAGLDKKLGIILINDTMDRDAAGAHLNVPMFLLSRGPGRVALLALTVVLAAVLVGRPECECAPQVKRHRDLSRDRRGWAFVFVPPAADPSPSGDDERRGRGDGDGDGDGDDNVGDGGRMHAASAATARPQQVR
jgi:hypothetical protein